MNPIGLSDSARRAADGQVYFGSFRSIDSQLILTGLASGTLVLAAALIALAATVILVLRRRASAATISVVAQIPALAGVALITQYSILVWFVIGLAAASQLHPRNEDAFLGREASETLPRMRRKASANRPEKPRMPLPTDPAPTPKPTRTSGGQT
jgi:hypothetical protein